MHGDVHCSAPGTIMRGGEGNQESLPVNDPQR